MGINDRHKSSPNQRTGARAGSQGEGDHRSSGRLWRHGKEDAFEFDTGGCCRKGATAHSRCCERRSGSGIASEGGQRSEGSGGKGGPDEATSDGRGRAGSRRNPCRANGAGSRGNAGGKAQRANHTANSTDSACASNSNQTTCACPNASKHSKGSTRTCDSSASACCPRSYRSGSAHSAPGSRNAILKRRSRTNSDPPRRAPNERAGSFATNTGTCSSVARSANAGSTRRCAPRSCSPGSARVGS